MKLEVNKDTHNQLLRLMSINNSIGITSKAIRSSQDVEKSLLSSEIIPTIRPIFDDRDESKIIASVIHYVLKIEYQQGDTLQEIYFASDMNDLKEMKENIIRAQLRSDSVRKKYGDAETIAIEVN